MAACSGDDGRGVALVGLGGNNESARMKVLLESMKSSHPLCVEG